jgi:hypothetical protein
VREIFKTSTSSGIEAVPDNDHDRSFDRSFSYRISNVFGIDCTLKKNIFLHFFVLNSDTKLHSRLEVLVETSPQKSISGFYLILDIKQRIVCKK